MNEAVFHVRRFRRWARFIHALGFFVRRLDIRPDVMPDTGGRPIVMVANHRSLADVFIAVESLSHFGAPTRCLVRAKYFETFGLRRWLRWLGCIPAGDGKRGSVEAALATLEQGTPVAIMVEGRITPPDHRDELGLGEFRPGFVEIARTAGAVILPIAIVGSDRIWGSRSMLPRIPWRGRPLVHVHLLDAVEIGDLSDDEVVAETRRRMGERIVALEAT